MAHTHDTSRAVLRDVLAHAEREALGDLKATGCIVLSPLDPSHFLDALLRGATAVVVTVCWRKSRYFTAVELVSRSGKPLSTLILSPMYFAQRCCEVFCVRSGDVQLTQAVPQCPPIFITRFI